MSGKEKQIHSITPPSYNAHFLLRSLLRVSDSNVLNTKKSAFPSLKRYQIGRELPRTLTRSLPKGLDPGWGWGDRRPLSQEKLLNVASGPRSAEAVPSNPSSLKTLQQPVTSGFPSASPQGLPPRGPTRPQDPTGREARSAGPVRQAGRRGIAPCHSRRHFPATVVAAA